MKEVSGAVSDEFKLPDSVAGDPPETVSSLEHIARTLYSPYHFDRRKNTVRPNCFKPRFSVPDEVESGICCNKISVNRSSYAGLDFILGHAERHCPGSSTGSGGERSEFQGFLFLRVGKVEQVAVEGEAGHAQVQANPVPAENGEPANPYHAHLRIPIEVPYQEGQKFPEAESSRFSKWCRELAKMGDFVSRSDALSGKAQDRLQVYCTPPR